MKKKRRRCFAVEPLEGRLCLAASLGWDGPGLGSANLTYHISGTPAGLSSQAVQSAVEAAFQAWSSVADVSFQQTNLAGLRDSIDITFRNIDGPGGTLAQAYLPDDVNPARIAGDIEFDLSDAWEVGNSIGNAAFDLVQVAVHEIGHALGLDHSNVLGSVMYPSVSPSQQFTSLAASDVDAILALYAPSTSGGTTTPTTPTDGDGDPSVNSTNETPETPNRRLPPFFGGRWFGRRWGGGRLGRIESGVVIGDTPTKSDTATRHNRDNAVDVNQDGFVSALDALLIINELNSQSSLAQVADGTSSAGGSMADTNGDNEITPVDVLLVINRLNGLGVESEGVEDGLSDVDDSTPIEDTEGPVDDTTDTDSDDMLNTPSDDGTVDDFGDVGNVEDPSDDGNVEDPTDNESDSDDSSEHCSHENSELNRLTPEERRTAKFESLDDDGNGELTEDEVDARLWERLVDFDANEDGAITLDEFPAIPIRHEHFPGAHRPGGLGSFDSNEDGSLTEDEVPAKVWEHISQFDADGDGAVSLTELPNLPPHHHGGRHGFRDFRRS